MIKFKTSQNLGQVADIIKVWCFGVDDIKTLDELRFYAGGNKFSNLCGFKFKSKMDSHEYPIFTIAFVPKLRDSHYRKTSNPSEWYIYKHVSSTQRDILTKEQLFINYGFDVDMFFDSDVFNVMKRKIIQSINNALIQKIPNFINTLKTSSECLDADKFKSSIQMSLDILKNPIQTVNNKYFKLYDNLNLDEKIEQELTRQGIYVDLNYADFDNKNILHEGSTMKKQYILTGYDVAKNKMTTNMFDDLEKVYFIIDQYSHDALNTKYNGSLHDFNFDIMSRRSHTGAVIIIDNKYKWSVFQVNK